jgi:hypothetical protein
MTGGLVPPGFVTLKVSVRHWLAMVATVPEAAVTRLIPLRRVSEVVSVEGPWIVKELMSRRSWQMLPPDTRQTLAVHEPEVVLVPSK